MWKDTTQTCMHVYVCMYIRNKVLNKQMTRIITVSLKN